mgnify:FL=1
MTNHIEQMMKVAGVCTKEYYLVSGEYWTRNLGGQPTKNKIYELVINVANAKSAEIKVIEDIRLKDKHSKRFYINAEKMEKYPPFTPAKQLELIKLLFKKIPTSLNFYFEPIENTDKWQYIHTDLTFEEALAEMVWNALTVLDKAEVKRVLEDE